MRNHLWGNFVDTVFKYHYLCFLLRSYQKEEKGINIFLAISSSSSIAAWAVWEELPMLWGGIIAATQVINAIKPYLAYTKIINSINSRLPTIDALVFEYAMLWNRYQTRKITEEQMEAAFEELENKRRKLFTFGDDISLSNDDNFSKKAETETRKYFKSNYNM